MILTASGRSQTRHDDLCRRYIYVRKKQELTPAETDVLREMTTGASNQEIADDLGISIGTVKTHISRILSKTGCPNRTALAIEARMRGLGAQS